MLPASFDFFGKRISMDNIKSSKPKDYLSLVSMLYKNKGMRSLNVAMKEASKQWKQMSKIGKKKK